MEQRVFHGKISPELLAECLLVHFNRGNLEVIKLGDGDQVAIQIRSKRDRNAGGETALGVTFQKVEDGVAVQVGSQAWAGIAASLGFSALAALRNPFNLIQRLDDIAQDLEYIQLTDEIWKTLEANARFIGSGYDISERLSSIACEYCLTSNPAAAPNCVSCGAPLGKLQPRSCRNCGYILLQADRYCPNCRRPVRLG